MQASRLWLELTILVLVLVTLVHSVYWITIYSFMLLKYNENICSIKSQTPSVSFWLSTWYSRSSHITNENKQYLDTIGRCKSTRVTLTLMKNWPNFWWKYELFFYIPSCFCQVMQKHLYSEKEDINIYRNKFSSTLKCTS